MSRKTPSTSVLFIATAPYTWLNVRLMFLERLRAANCRLLTSSLLLLAKGVMMNATKKDGMPDACACLCVERGFVEY